MKSPFLARAIASGLLAATALAPVTAFAATPQMALNAALMRLSEQKTANISMEANVSIVERPLVRDGRWTNFDLGMRMNVRTVQAADGNFDGEGTVDLVRFKAESKEGTETESWSLDSPFTMNWANRDQMSYVRFQNLPNSLVELAKNEGDVDLTQIIGMWIGFESSRDALVEEFGSRYEDLVMPAEIAAEGDLLKRYPPIQVLRIEKRWKINGDSIVRLRARVNPNLVYALQRKEVADEVALSRRLGETLTQRNKRVAEINTRYAELRRALAGVGMAINLNETQGSVERFEIGGKFTVPQKTFVWNESLQRSVEKTTSMVDAKFSIGMNFLPLNTAAVEHPAYWRPFQEILEMLEPKRPEPLLVEPVETNTIDSGATIIIP